MHHAYPAGLLCTLIGHKTPRFVEQNTRLTKVAPLSAVEFKAAIGSYLGTS